MKVMRLELKQESPAVERKPRDAAAAQLFFSFKFKFKSSQASNRRPCSKLQTYRRKTEFNAKWPFKVTQGQVFWSQWKGDQGLSNTKY